MFTEWFQMMTLKNSAKRRVLRTGAVSGLETLEDRVLLAATASLVEGKVKIEGSDSDDTVDIVENESDEIVVTIDSEGSVNEFTYNKADVKRIDFRGKKGNDIFINNTSIRSRAFGGEGNDSLTGGSALDVLRGNDGNDSIDGAEGNDRLRGGNNNDEINGGEGHDFISGNFGNDLLLGDAGRDRLNGGQGNDILAGGADRDRLIDRWGRNKLYQGDLPEDGGANPDSTAGVALRRGKLLIKGTNDDDQVVISDKDDSHIEVSLTTNGETTLHTFSTRRVRLILFNGLDGNDSFTNSTDIRSIIKGDS